MSRHFPFAKQINDSTCGPACAQMVLAADGIRLRQSTLAKQMKTLAGHGTRRSRFAPLFRAHGYRAMTKTGASIHDLKRLLSAGWSVVVNYRELDENISHFAIVLAVTESTILFNDPWHGPDYRLPLATFIKRWYGSHVHSHKRWLVAAQRRPYA